MLSTMNSKGRLKNVCFLMFLSLSLLNVIPAAPVQTNSTYDMEKYEMDVIEKAVMRAFLQRMEKVANDTNDNIRMEHIVQEFAQLTGDMPYEEETTEDSPLGPSITCAYFNIDECEKKGRCEVTTEVCQPEAHLRGVGCYAVFNYPPVIESNSTINMSEIYMPVHKSQYQKLGCIQFQDPDMMACSHDKICRQSQTVRQVGHCCCGTDNCNGQGLEQINPAHWNNEQEKKKAAIALLSTPSTDLDDNLDVIPIYGLITIVMAFIFVLACCLLAYVAYRFSMRQKEEVKKRTVENEKTDTLENGHTPLVSSEEPIEMVEKPKPLPLSDFVEISSGNFGTVHRAKWTSENGEEKYVAVKKLPLTQRICFDAEKATFEYLKTCPKWYNTIVGYQCAQQVGNELIIVTEFHERLSLFDLLKHNVISLPACQRLLLTMTDGLQFLHDDRPYYACFPKKPIIHRDIKSKNILVKSDMTACIADFGLARFYEPAKVSDELLGRVGTQRYMAPEMTTAAIDMNSEGFKALDVYSMAIVMWETISRTRLNADDVVPDYKVPYHEGLPKANNKNEEVIRPKWRQEVLDNHHTQFYAQVTTEMWVEEAAARITAACGFTKIWNHVFTNGSLGYCTESESSNGEEEGPIVKNIDTTERWMSYHEKYEDPNPTPDPFNVKHTPVPPIPIITGERIIFGDSTDSKESAIETPKDSRLENVQHEEKFFILGTSELLSKEQNDARLVAEKMDAIEKEPPKDEHEEISESFSI